MENKLTIAAALIAGLAGGMLTRYIAPPPVFAQAPVQTWPPPPGSVRAPLSNEIRAQNFTLVDQSDHVIGTFSGEPQRGGFTRIVLRDGGGREIWHAGGNPLIQPATASLK